MGQFLTLKDMVTKFFKNSNFSDFLGIKSEISQYSDTTVNGIPQLEHSVICNGPSLSEVAIIHTLLSSVLINNQ